MKIQSIFINAINQSIQYFIGENANDNWSIIDDANPDDIWFHISDRPSCHVIANIQIKLTKKEMKYVIKQGALLCKQNSKYKSERNLTIVYTKIQNVKKTNIVGSVEISNDSTINI
jgi:predicted ribosome quality control (RQC) complex YloA/Tae2 family protein